MGKNRFLAVVDYSDETPGTIGHVQSTRRAPRVTILDDSGKTEKTLEAAADTKEAIEEEIALAGYVVHFWEGRTAHLERVPTSGAERFLFGCIWQTIGFTALVLIICVIAVYTA
ncbi:MAG TPA: hypothetical protein VFI97_08220 [Arthrobacter sp.]|nr:hypothetical protein [Arthrobacter sp.]